MRQDTPLPDFLVSNNDICRDRTRLICSQDFLSEFPVLDTFQAGVAFENGSIYYPRLAEHPKIVDEKKAMTMSMYAFRIFQYLRSNEGGKVPNTRLRFLSFCPADPDPSRFHRVGFVGRPNRLFGFGKAFRHFECDGVRVREVEPKKTRTADAISITPFVEGGIEE